jgi:hypothetical protein
VPTQAIPGYSGRAYLSDDGGSNYVEVGELRDVELTIQTEMMDATSHASAGSKEVIPGIQSWTATAGALYVSSDSAQDKIDAAVTGKTKLKFRFDPEGTAVTKERFAGDGYISNWKLGNPNNDLAARNIDIVGTGALVKSTQ